MAYRYKDLIRGEIEPMATPGHGILHAFAWRGVHYPVAQILGRWHLQTRWWNREKHSDRLYYRDQTPYYGVYEIYYDQMHGVWVLDMVLDMVLD